MTTDCLNYTVLLPLCSILTGMLAYKYSAYIKNQLKLMDLDKIS